MIVLGIDGGGTKTHALALDEAGHLIGSGSGGRSNYHLVGLDAAVACIQDAALEALHGNRADMAVYCLAACDTALDEGRLTRALGAVDLAPRFVCLNDAFAALRAGTTRPYGVSVICGTGFNACGIAPDGTRAILHSLGTLTGDWGGGYSLGEAVFGVVFRADEGRGPATQLTDMLLKALNLPDLDAVAQAIIDNRIDTLEVGAVAPLVFEAAERGDTVAIQIVERQADEIAIGAVAMLRRLGMLHTPVDVVLSGGVIRGGGALLHSETHRRIHTECPTATITNLNVPAVIGAALLAFDALGITAPTADDLSEAVAAFWGQAAP